MSRLFVFADEAGDFEFSRKANASKYFILCTVSMSSCEVAHDLLRLRRDLAWDDHDLGDSFHCTTDKQVVRDAVFEIICAHDFLIHATIMEKSKAQLHIRESRARFYQFGWYYHFKHGPSRQLDRHSELLVTTASIGLRKERTAFENAVVSVMKQTVDVPSKTDFRPAAADPCVQVADYCAWAIQRKYERSDSRSYDLIKDKIAYEYDLWAHGKKHFY